MAEFSDYVVYVDESGDHSLESIDSKYPIFVLSLCVFHKRHYAEKVVSRLQKHKFKYFGHDIIVYHERDINKQTGEFSFLSARKKQDDFLSDITEVIEKINFVLIACVIRKNKLQSRYATAEHPYHLAMKFGLERLHRFLTEKNQQNRITHVVVEKRGRAEDKDLELAFRRICDGENAQGEKFPFEIVVADKKVNSAGLQLADLTARPIGNHVLRPDQPNRSFEAFRHKFYCKGGRNETGVEFAGWGLKIFP